jgi:hypothetical protein
MADIITNQSGSAGSDATLLALCSEFDRLDKAALAVRRKEKSLGKALESRDAVADKIAATKAVTHSGLRAKAAVALVLMREAYGDNPDTTEIVVAHSVLVDMAVCAVTAALPTSSTSATESDDTELLAAYGAFVAAHRDIFKAVEVHAEFAEVGHSAETVTAFGQLQCPAHKGVRSGLGLTADCP